eukprot:symbB.v1.2.029816.t1/scaffold3301.1/size59484/9
MILDQKLNGTLDQGVGVLIVFDQEQVSSTYDNSLKTIKNTSEARRLESRLVIKVLCSSLARSWTHSMDRQSSLHEEPPAILAQLVFCLVFVTLCATRRVVFLRPPPCPQQTVAFKAFSEQCEMLKVVTQQHTTALEPMTRTSL